jgi:hypothetical protein
MGGTRCKGREADAEGAPIEQCPRHRASPSIMPDGTQGKYCKVNLVRIIRQKLPRFELPAFCTG